MPDTLTPHSDPAAPTASSPAAGFSSMEEEIRVSSLPVSGALPAWLGGTLVRVTPALLDVGGSPIRHWFDGLAMLNAFSFGEGRVGYASRFLDTEALRKARQGEWGVAGFATDPCRSLFKRVMTIFEGPSNDNCNVNLARLGDRYLAMTELPLPVSFDPETLETHGAERFSDRLRGQVSTAHPHRDPVTGELLNYVAHFSRKSSYRVFAQAPGSGERRELARIPVRNPAYMHSFAVTERYVVLAEYPLVLNPLRLAFSGKAFIDYYEWEPERGTTFTVVDRGDGRVVATPAAPAFFCFHHLNAYEEGGGLVVDLVAYDDPSLIELLEVEALRSLDGRLAGGELRRYRVPLGGGEVRGERLSGAALELPRINYSRNGRRHRFAYGAGLAGDDSVWFDRLVKLDVEDGSLASWAEEGCYPGEPVFTPAPSAAAEDDGLILSVVLDGRTSKSFLVVLDAAGFTELARAELPHHIPFGFHGQHFR